MSFDTDELVAEWVTRIAHQARHKLDPGGIAAWQNALRGLTPARLEMAFQDHFEIASPSIGMPSAREIKAHVARQLGGEANERAMAEATKVTPQKAQWNRETIAEMFKVLDHYSPDKFTGRTAEAVEKWAKDFAQARVDHCRRFRLEPYGMSEDAFWKQEYKLMMDTLTMRLQRMAPVVEKEPVAAPVLPDGRVVRDEYDPENPDDLKF